MNSQPRIFHILNNDALEMKQTPYGSVGTIYAGEGIEAVWVSKADEEIEPGWFSQSSVDLIAVVQGQLKVEFEQPGRDDEIMNPGDVLALPAGLRCRAYRWPRERPEASVFLAVYPTAK